MELGEASRVDPRLQNSVIAQSMPFRIVDEDKDRQIIDQWLLEKGKFQLNPFILASRKSPLVTISSAKLALKNCLEIIEKLDMTQEELRAHVDTMSSNDWKEKTLEIGCLKEKFDTGMTMFEDNTVLKTLKGSVCKRRKKRISRKKRNLQKKVIKAERVQTSLEITKKVDKWLDQKKDEVERAKNEERMKKDADCVLDEVTKKKSEARKELSLISALVKLRTVRDSMAQQRGEKLSLEDRHAFGSVTEKLIRMWENSYQVYCKEEECLKSMLEHNVTNDKKVGGNSRQLRIIDEWEKVIFGRNEIPQQNQATFMALTAADRDLESFIAIRKSWDTFRSNVDGSAIPIGWVVPPSTPNNDWMAFMHN